MVRSYLIFDGTKVPADPPEAFSSSSSSLSLSSSSSIPRYIGEPIHWTMVKPLIHWRILRKNEGLIKWEGGKKQGLLQILTLNQSNKANTPVVVSPSIFRSGGCQIYHLWAAFFLCLGTMCFWGDKFGQRFVDV